MTPDPLDELREAVRAILSDGDDWLCPDEASTVAGLVLAPALERVLALLDLWEASGGYDRMGNYIRVETMDEIRAALTGETP